METDKEVILTLAGDVQDINALTISDSLRHLAHLVEGFPTHDGKAKLATLREGSAVTGVLTDPETSRRLQKGISHLGKEQSIPDSWSIAQVRSLEKIVETAGGGRGATLKIADDEAKALDAGFKEAISQAMTQAPKSIGSVIGELTRYNGSGRTRLAGLQQENTGKSVEVSLDGELWESAIKLMHERVEIAGLVTRHPETNVIEKVSARSITALPYSGVAAAGLGIWQDIEFDEENTEETVRQLRDG